MRSEACRRATTACFIQSTPIFQQLTHHREGEAASGDRGAIVGGVVAVRHVDL